jgi:hypothetical protein
MTTYQCQNPECLKQFLHTAKLTTGSNSTQFVSLLETQVCPFCNSKNYTDYVEIVTEETANVLVIELTTGPQIAIDKALAEGYKVVARYAKQYHLEKAKTEVKA